MGEVILFEHPGAQARPSGYGGAALRPRSRVGAAARMALAILLAAGATAFADGVAAQVATGQEQLRLQLDRTIPEPSTQQTALDRLEQAIEAWDEGDHVRGAYLADSALALLPTLSDWRPVVLAELLVPIGDTAAVRSALAPLTSSGEYWSRWGWAILTDAYEEAEDFRGAARIARSQARLERNPEQASRGWARAGELSLQAGDSVPARADLWEALDYGPDFRGARQAAELIDAAPWPIDDADALRLGRSLLAARSWSQAHARLAPILGGQSGVPEPDDAGELRVALGQGLFELRRYQEAEAILSPLTEEGTPLELRTPALYWTGRAMLGRGAVIQAESTLRRLAESDPRSRWAERGLSVLLTRELETGFGPRARGFLDELLRVGVSSSSTGTTVVQLGSTQYLSRDYLSAARTFEQYLQGSGSSSLRQQAGYWAALTLERAGRTPDARSQLEEVHREDPLTFYGVFAGERIGAAVLPADIPEGPPPVTGLERELTNAVLRLRVHRLVPTSGSFSYELDRLTALFAALPGGEYEFGEALIEGGLPLEAIVLGRRIRAREGSWNLRLLGIVHPFPHREIIVREASRHGLDPFFVAGLIRQESAFEARIESVSGAVGLMQLMPPTAREMAQNVGIPYAPDIRRDPETNLRLGITYLASMVGRFDGRAEDVLSAYNAGPTRMRRWRNDATYRDRDVFMEHIPFEETRNYVKVVQQYARVYSALYGCGNFEPCLGLPYHTLVAQSPFAGGQPRIALTRD